MMRFIYSSVVCYLQTYPDLQKFENSQNALMPTRSHVLSCGIDSATATLLCDLRLCLWSHMPRVPVKMWKMKSASILLLGLLCLALFSNPWKTDQSCWHTDTPPADGMYKRRSPIMVPTGNKMFDLGRGGSFVLTGVIQFPFVPYILLPPSHSFALTSASGNLAWGKIYSWQGLSLASIGTHLDPPLYHLMLQHPQTNLKETQTFT